MSDIEIKPGTAVRLQAARILLAVTEEYQQLDDAIDRYNESLSTKDAALCQAICYGVMRYHAELVFWMEHLADRPAEELKPAVQILILSGLFQLKYMRVPAHAAIHSTVECAASLRSTRAKGLINAILRGFQRHFSAADAAKYQQIVQQQPETALYAHPQWMLERFKSDWPEHWQRIARHNNEQAPMTLRLDVQQLEMQDYLIRLKSAGIEATRHPIAASAVILSQPLDVKDLPGFSEGLVSVQDAAAQLAAPMLQHNDGQRVLDACAAPGGKTAHILQLAKPASLLALDNSAARLEKVTSMLQRLGASAEVVVGDAAHTDNWWDGKLFDRILLDAPCSASGVIRRHPDIKYLRSEKALQKIIKRQKKILDAMWQLLKPKGMLLYVTCSIFKAENEDQVSAFLQRYTDARLAELSVAWGIGKTGRQLLPGDDDMDGFYFAPLIKS